MQLATSRARLNSLSASDLEFYRARAAQCGLEAQEATLERVRERYRRAEAAWETMAAQAERSEQLRLGEIERKAEQGLVS